VESREAVMSNLHEHIRVAHEAYYYTQKIVYRGASNREDDRQKAKEEAGLIAKLTPDKVAPWLPKAFRPALTVASVEQEREARTVQAMKAETVTFLKEERVAEVVAESGIGNCGEQSAVAFSYLLRHARHTTFGITALGANHEFILIGVEPGSVRGHYALTAAPPWGPDAVILDCWKKVYFIVAESWPIVIPETLQEAERGYNKPTVYVEPIRFHVRQWVDNPLYRQL
jgi:hypothetical protein